MVIGLVDVVKTSGHHVHIAPVRASNLSVSNEKGCWIDPHTEGAPKV